MNPAARSREEKEKHPERFCPDARCLWRVETRSGTRPCLKHMTTPSDALGADIKVGSVLIATGLQNAGRYYTVQTVGRGGRVRLIEHLTGRDFWTFARHYRVSNS